MNNEMKLQNVEYVTRVQNVKMDVRNRIVLDKTVADAILNGMEVYIIVVNSEIATEEEV